MDDISVDHLLTTTRSVRKRLDLGRAVDPRIIQECIDLAVQAPNGGNAWSRTSALDDADHGG